jgi:carboxylesterase type B
MLSLFLLLYHLSSALAVDTVVRLDYASYQGTSADGVTRWLGMRYAAPPTDALRFAAPQDPQIVSGVQSAQKVGLVLQRDLFALPLTIWQHGELCLGTGDNPRNPNTSEDCLFIDVYAPSVATNTSKLPVYFFIQGGGFNFNSNANYDGSGLIAASQNQIVVVTFNYRVGPYGFLASQEVQASPSASLNNGLKDQRKALEWVQKYISRFGGDPKHVVLGGDSAGAASITYHLTAYGGRNDGLFVVSNFTSTSFALSQINLRPVPTCILED